MLKQLVRERWLTASGVIGFWPANADGDDIVLYTDDSRTERLTTLHTLRQQMARTTDRGNVALADFVAPVGSGVADYVGGFAVTAGIGEDAGRRALQPCQRRLFEDPLPIARRPPRRGVRRGDARPRAPRILGYAAGENLAPEQLIAEAYQGIRPAPGYPAQPDHTEKRTLFDLLDAETEIV